MTEIDLHGVRHEASKRLLERAINQLWGTDEELHIITGHSPKMKELVIDILSEYKLEYTIGDYSGHNMGFIRTHIE